MIADLASTDLSGRRREYLFQLPSVVDETLLPLLNDRRDAPILYLLWNICTLAVPGAGLLFSLPGSHVFGAIFLTLNYVLFLQRFILTLHFTEHRPLFRKGLYRLHHVIMHHMVKRSCFEILDLGIAVMVDCLQGANRSQADLSSTERYQRDNLLHFIWYWARFAFAIWFELPVYALKRQQYSISAGCLAAACGYWGFIAILWRWHPIATIWSLVVPFCMTSFLLMFGNWCQHIFIDSDNPNSSYAMTYNCVACPDNQLSFNDGYHILHHLNPKYHWSELPAKFLELLDKHDQQGALVFHGISFFDVGLAVFTGRLGYLADRLVRCGPKEQSWSREQIIQILRQRLRPVAASQ